MILHRNSYNIKIINTRESWILKITSFIPSTENQSLTHIPLYIGQKSKNPHDRACYIVYIIIIYILNDII